MISKLGLIKTKDMKYIFVAEIIEETEEYFVVNLNPGISKYKKVEVYPTFQKNDFVSTKFGRGIIVGSSGFKFKVKIKDRIHEILYKDINQ